VIKIYVLYIIDILKLTLKPIVFIFSKYMYTKDSPRSDKQDFRKRVLYA